MLNAIYTGKHRTLKELEETPYINRYQLKRILDDLLEIEFIETTGKTSGIKYLIHKSKLIDSTDERQYLSQKKQERFRQQETLMRYLDEFEEIDNQKAREILNLPDTQTSYVSRLLAEMLDKQLIEVARETKHNQRVYQRVKV